MLFFSLCLTLFIYLFFISLVFIFFGFYFLMNGLIIFVEYELFMLNSSQVIMTLLFDWMSLIFIGFVFLISSFIIYYSKDYMINEVNFDRFIILVFMFVLSMMFLILSPNLISILLGWDGLGLSSYCLVIYYQNMKSFNAGMITVLFNRVGDCMLLMSIAWMLSYGSWNYWIYTDFFNLNSYDVNIIIFFIIISSMTKSAQIPFSPWLPAAMAAPTPVSSLVHSSTLVTAGVYLLIRFNSIYLNFYFSTFLLIISLLTMFMSGFCANFEFDLKSIVALSTLSQLGLMMSILSFGFVYLAFFHLLIHALFKALLFMCSGVIIHNFKDCQDIRFLGNLFIQMPLTSVCFIISSFCLCGVPFLSGFYSKDLILEIYSLSYINIIGYFLFYISTGLTVMYSFRLIYYLMISDFSFYSFYNICDNSITMLKPMYFMLFLSIFGGCIMSWMIFPTPYIIIIPLWMKFMVLIVSLLGIYFGYLIIKFDSYFYIKNFFYYLFSMFFGNMWFMTYVSLSFSYFFLFMGLRITSSIDSGWLELLGGQGFMSLFNYGSIFNQKVQVNSFNIFFMIISFWIILLVLF
nr:NADH dehydrogenase subunit 5 [Nanhuaphasma hamicercum]